MSRSIRTPLLGALLATVFLSALAGAAGASTLRLTSTPSQVSLTSVLRDGLPVRVGAIALDRVPVSCRLSNGAEAAVLFSTRLRLALAPEGTALSFRGTESSRSHDRGARWESRSRVKTTIKGTISSSGRIASGWFQVRTWGVAAEQSTRIASVCRSGWLRWSAAA